MGGSSFLSHSAVSETISRSPSTPLVDTPFDKESTHDTLDLVSVGIDAGDHRVCKQRTHRESIPVSARLPIVTTK